jgi:hypothetical protein
MRTRPRKLVFSKVINVFENRRKGPNPDRNEVLVFSNEGVFLNEKTASVTLHQYAAAHCLPDYTTFSSVLKDIDHFGKYKIVSSILLIDVFDHERIDPEAIHSSLQRK